MKKLTVTVSGKDERELARQLIEEAMRLYRGGMYVELPEASVGTHETFEKLDRQQVDQGVTAAILHLDLEAGSSYEIDLYKTMQAVLLDPEKRKKIYEIICR